MVPLHVKFTLASPINVPERPVHLDALLAWSAVDLELAAGVKGDVAVLAQEHLPLERTEGDDWVWKASQLLFRPLDQPFIVPGIRTTNIQEMAFHRSTGLVNARSKVFIDLGSGHLRNYDYRFPSQWCSVGEAWCFGAPDKVRASLSRLRGIGKRIRNGWGAIREIAVVEVAAADCHWNRRTLPADAPNAEQPGHVPATGTLRPPYWDRLNYTEVLEYVPMPPSPAGVA